MKIDKKLVVISIFTLIVGSLIFSGCGGSSSSSTSSSSSSSTSSSSGESSTTVPSSSDTSSIDYSTAIFVSPDGLDNNDGTVNSPTTLATAITKLASGGTIYMRGGTYSYTSTITIAWGNNGTSGSTKNIYAYPGELPILDFSAQSFGSSNRGIQLYGHYWHLKGLQIKGAGDNGLYVGGSNNTIEDCEFYQNRDSGLQLGRYSSSCSKSDWPANNLIKYCHSHDNYDPDNGEDADGFACKLTTGEGNVFYGCIASYNADDGWDLYTKSDYGAIGAVTLKYCIAHHNGATSAGLSATDGDKNGFKLGGSYIAVNHIVDHCIAFSNLNRGFDNNNNNGSITITNCTAYHNGINSGKANFNFNEGSHIFTNNLSFDPVTTANDDDVFYSTNTYSLRKNIWWKDGTSSSCDSDKLSCVSSDFVSLTIPTEVTRNADGSPNLGDFLKLKPTSALAGAGTDGNDIGARSNQNDHF